VKGKQGEHHDALFNKNNRVEIAAVMRYEETVSRRQSRPPPCNQSVHVPFFGFRALRVILPLPARRERANLSTAIAIWRGRGPAVKMTDTERERVKKGDQPLASRGGVPL
jgi:hypothetical protein